MLLHSAYIHVLMEVVCLCSPQSPYVVFCVNPLGMLIPVDTHTHPFNGPLSGTTRVSQYQKGKTNLDYPAWITTVESTQVALYNTSPMPVPSLLNLHASINGLLTDSKAKSTKLAMATQPTNSIYKHGDRCWMLWVQAAGRGTAITTDINSDNTEGEVTSHNLCLR